MLLQSAGNQDNKCSMIAQEVPYKMQNPKVKPSRNHNFGTTWKHYKMPNQVSFFDGKMVLVQIARPKMYFGYHSQVQNGPNRLTYFLEEIQAPMKMGQ